MAMKYDLKVKVQGKRYAFGIYQDGTWQVSRIAPYDDQDYHYAKSVDEGVSFNIYLNGKFIKKYKVTGEDSFNDYGEFDFNEFSVYEVADELLKLDKRANLKPMIVHY